MLNNMTICNYCNELKTFMCGSVCIKWQNENNKAFL